jgi:hypothetical protein
MHSLVVQSEQFRHSAIMKSLIFLVLIALVLTSAPVLAQQGNEQGQVRKEMRAGNVRPLREIERKVVPMMSGMQYLGPEYDPAALAYRLKFIRDGRVIFVDVDARSGDIIRQSR